MSDHLLPQLLLPVLLFVSFMLKAGIWWKSWLWIVVIGLERVTPVAACTNSFIGWRDMLVHGRRILFEPENSESISRRLSPFVSEDYRSFCNRQRRLCCIMSDPIALIIGTVLKTAFYVIRFVLYNVTLLGLDFMGWFIGWMVRNVPAFWILVVLLLLVVAGKILRRWDLCAF